MGSSAFKVSFLFFNTMQTRSKEYIVAKISGTMWLRNLCFLCIPFVT